MASILEKTTGLVAFVRTVDAGSFSAASRLIGSSQSAVSKSVARLERRLGVRLIQRSTRTLRLTSEGSAYYERVAPLLRAIEEAEDVVQVASEAKGLGAPMNLSRYSPDSRGCPRGTATPSRIRPGSVGALVIKQCFRTYDFPRRCTNSLAKR